MDFQFIIPRNNDELLDSHGNNYFVKQVYNANEINYHLKAAYQALCSSDAFYIFDHFDTFFSIIQNAQKMQLNQLIRAVDILHNTTQKYGVMVDAYLKQTELNQQSSYLNLTKMVLYLLVSTVRAIDIFIRNATNDAASNKQKSGKKAAAEIVGNNTDWDDKRYAILVQVFNIMQLKLERLWNLSIAEEEFVNMLCEVGYRSLDHYSIKEKRVNDAVFQIFGIAIKQYNHAIAFPVRIIQILSTQELAVVPIARGVQLLSEEYGITTVFGVLLKDLIDALGVDTCDPLMAKHVSQFLTEICENSPRLVVPHLSAMSQDLLNLDSYVIRNAVLSIMGNVIIRELTAETLDEEQKETRDEFIEDLLSHMNDVSSYTRSKVLQIWNEMKVDSAVPLAWYIKVMRTTVERLDDKTAMVRKNSVILLKSFLETNPFAAKLSLQELKVQLEEESNKLQAIRDQMVEQDRNRDEINQKFEEEDKPQLIPILQEALRNELEMGSNIDLNQNNDAVERIRDLLVRKKYNEIVDLIISLDSGNRENRMAMQIEEQCFYFLVLINSYLFNDYETEYDVKMKQVEFLSDSLEFSEIITKAVPKLEELLMSKTNTDVFEAVDFFTTGYLFNIKGTESGMRRMLSLIWTGDKEKRSAVTKAYHRVLFETDCQGRAHTLKVIDNLYNFFKNINVGEYSAIEAMVKEWIEANVIDANMIQVFFERFTQKLPNTSDNLSRCCLQLLTMASTAKQSIVAANKDIITSIGFGERGQKDPRIFAACLELLTNQMPINANNFYQRIERNENVDNLLDIFKKMFFYPRLPKFEIVATRVINYIYHLYQAPDVLCQELLFAVCEKLVEISDKKLATMDELDEEPVETVLPTYLLARIIFVFGYIAMKEMIFLDIDVYNNMKYRDDLKQEKKNLKKTSNKRKTHSLSLNSSASDVLKRLTGSAAEPQQEPDEMLVGATAEDSIAELIHQICESELICAPSGLLHNFIPILMEILNHPGKYRNEKIQLAACLTLVRFMSVSSKFCNEHIPFLMNVMQKTKNPAIKCNIIIGLSDFTCRFPNVIEPWTAHLYGTLLEPDVNVRLTAVKMLSHLILQEMIRVRGQLSDMAICIVDDNESIRSVTKEFFKEISHKSNILYNVLPDIISRLSSSDLQIEEDKYHVIMRYIMRLIQKDRQVESLVEKLCLRFRITTNERQWRDIAFCLSLLTYTEKTIKKLIDHVPYFKDKIQVDEVYDCFKTIISNTNKLAKPEMKAITKDFENKLQECLQVNENGVENAAESENRSNDGDNANAPAIQRKKRGQKVKGKGRNRNQSSSSSNSDFEEAEPKRPAAKAVLPNRNRKVQRVVVETESDDSSSDDSVPAPPPSKRGGRRR